MTREAPWFSFHEDERGVLEPGRLADITVLSEDFSVLASDLPQIRSDMTMVGGEIVWSSLGD